MSKDQILEWNSEGLLAEVVGYETDEVALSTDGPTITTYRCKEFLDFTSGIAVNACGHNHPDVVSAIREQAGRVLHTSDIMRHAPQLELAHWLRDLLAERAPGDPWTFQFMNSGSESIDTAAKLALKATGRGKFIAFEGAFHGRTLFATALSCSKSIHRQAYEPLLSCLNPAIFHAPAPRCTDCAVSSRPRCCVDGVERLLKKEGAEIAALFFEPQQGEGGYYPMTPEAAQRLRELTREYGVLMIADEIQSGFGRTGRWFGFEHLGIIPDMIVFGKAVGGGLPLAGVAAPKRLMEQWTPGEHGTTFGGNPIACAAGLAALRCIEREDLVSRSALMGERIKARLRPLIGRNGLTDVRGNGLMIGIELRDEQGEPDYTRAAKVKFACRERGLLVLTCGAHIGVPETDNAAIRLIPPLNISEQDLDRGLDILVEALLA